MKVSVEGTPEIVSLVRITLDGVDVTDDCFEADDEAGTVGLYPKPIQVADGKPVAETKRGRVVIEATGVVGL